jgi:hypothetical protein
LAIRFAAPLALAPLRGDLGRPAAEKNCAQMLELLGMG